MSNFQFISTDFPKMAAIAQKAERFALTDPVESCFNSRSAMEIGINWMYQHDAGLRLPYNTSLASLMNDWTFKAFFQPELQLYNELHGIRKSGNIAVHQQKASTTTAVHLLRSLHRFAAYLSMHYGSEAEVFAEFDETYLPKGAALKKSRKELEALQARIAAMEAEREQERKALEAREQENELLRTSNEQTRARFETLRHERATREHKKALPTAPSEAYTRKLYIDTALADAGWTELREGYELEYEVQGMPKATNPSGRGYADYVLWGENGLPLAVIEAKKTTANASNGRHQASLYADCLEARFGQRPLIYYTNGFDFYFWDDLFAPSQQVSGFLTKDQMELHIRRRQSRKNLREFSVNPEITNRAYQVEAIQRVAENFCAVEQGQVKQRHSRSLLIMATGSGKTRTAASITDMMTSCNWAKRVLFLVDRNALVTQAKNAFKEHLPELSSIDLTKEKENNTTRLVFSTYPTMMNQINQARSGAGRFYGPGHFDLIIIDEAHRSVYQKYGAIFDYFQGFLLGLTATPKEDIDHNTYELFDTEVDDPTFAYELSQAVADGYLVPPRAISVPLKFMREGIRYAELSEKEKREYEEKYGDPGAEEVEASIDKNALYRWLFNTNTVDQVLNHLMTAGLKVDGGDKLGKTIIFAKNHKHALYIKERFDHNYPHLATDKFCEVIDNKVSHTENLIDGFKQDKEEKLPQIAISVDMLDTGVDAPRVVNLVFFKLVRSKTKYWQMIGRGTRLRPHLFGYGKDKEYFLVFDYCENFEFFEDFPDGIKASTSLPLSQQVFALRLELIQAFRLVPGREEQAYGEEQVNLLHQQVTDLDQQRFQVRAQLEHVLYFSKHDNWADLGPSQMQRLTHHVLPLILPEKGDHIAARRFDVLMLNFQLALLGHRDTRRYTSRIENVCRILRRKTTIPAVVAGMPVIDKVLTYQFLGNASVTELEEVRAGLRDLMQFLEAQEQQADIETHFQDYLNLEKVEEKDIMKEPQLSLLPYRKRVERYLNEHRDHLVIYKIRNNEPITEPELEQLQSIFFNADEVGSEEEYQQEGGDKPLVRFIREITGLDQVAVQQAFARFIDSYQLNAAQIRFLDLIISFLTKNGVIENRVLFESPFKDLHDQGPYGLFDDAQVTKIISILDRINGNAEMG